jgi:hypothetical protein
MSNARLIRWSGLALILGGAGFAVHLITHPPGETAQFVPYALWIPSHLLGAVASLLLALGLVGMYARQSKEVGAWGLVGFLLTFIATILSAGALIFLSSIIIPFLVSQGLGSMVDPKGPLLRSPTALVTIGLTAICLLLGLIILAVATLRARVLPRLGAQLVITTVPLSVAGLVLVFFIGTSYQGVVGALVGVVLGAGLAAWGWALWSEKAETVSQAGSMPLLAVPAVPRDRA